MRFNRPIAALACLALWAVPAAASAAVHRAHATPHTLSSGNPDLGSNVIIFNPSMSQASIQSELNTISTQQVPNQFGPQRYSIFFEPGTYGSASDPLVFQVGFYTQVAGLGEEPGDVTINGAIDVFNQCINGSCEGTDNFWRSISNLTLNIDLPPSPPAYAPDPNENAGAGWPCTNYADFLALSQADPIRSVIINGSPILQDFCGYHSGDNDVSGGFMANDEVNGALNFYGQQQYFVRNSNIGSSSNYVWNQVFLGVNGAPATDFGQPEPSSTNPKAQGQYTTVATTPVSEEEPFLYTDSHGAMNVFVPALQHDSVGPSYASGSQAGYSVPISRFFVANPSTPVWQINLELALGKNLLLTPGVYDLPQAIRVDYPNTIVMGLGFATLIPQNGNAAMLTANVPGIKLSGLIFDAGPVKSQDLLELGDGPGFSQASDPTNVQDVFFRVGGAEPGKVDTAFVVNDSNVLLDDIWSWRADHGAGAGWTLNTADTGLAVYGDNVYAYGLAVEHYQKNEVIWSGQHGEVVFFQNEMPYDPPSQAAWMSNPQTDGYPAFLVTNNVRSFQGYGMGSYSYFNQGVNIYASNAFVAPDRPGVQFNDLLTIFLNPNGGMGGIDNVINGVGGSSTINNPDTPVDVTTYP